VRKVFVDKRREKKDEGMEYKVTALAGKRVSILKGFVNFSLNSTYWL